MERSDFLKALVPPVAVVVVSLVLLQLLSFVFGPPADLIFNVIRILAVGWGGWPLARAGIGSVWAASLGGPLMLLVDHVVIKGVSFLLAFQRPLEWRLTSVLGVFVSYFMFLPVAALVSLTGGLVGRSLLRRQQGAV